MAIEASPPLQSGIQILEKIIHSFAPSMDAASITSVGILFMNLVRRYTAKGEKNPEYSRYDTEEEAVFEDRGGFEEPTEIPKEKKSVRTHGAAVKVKTKGKVIK